MGRQAIVSTLVASCQMNSCTQMAHWVLLKGSFPILTENDLLHFPQACFSRSPGSDIPTAWQEGSKTNDPPLLAGLANHVIRCEVTSEAKCNISPLHPKAFLIFPRFQMTPSAMGYDRDSKSGILLSLSAASNPR